jgi:hypothetical protein
MRRNLFNNENPIASSQGWSVDATGLEHALDPAAWLSNAF